MVMQRQPDYADASDYQESFRLEPGESLQQVMDDYEDVARETESVVRRLPVDHAVPVPRDVPWFPHDVESWSVRWVLLHLIEETARHAGHADIVRESIDGATWFPLMAAAENWPPTPWFEPWRPKAAADRSS
jgi:hypothetical protein